MGKPKNVNTKYFFRIVLSSFTQCRCRIIVHRERERERRCKGGESELIDRSIVERSTGGEEDDIQEVEFADWTDGHIGWRRCRCGRCKLCLR